MPNIDKKIEELQKCLRKSKNPISQEDWHNITQALQEAYKEGKGYCIKCDGYHCSDCNYEQGHSEDCLITQVRQEAYEECIEAVGEEQQCKKDCTKECKSRTEGYNQAKAEIREELNKLKS